MKKNLFKIAAVALLAAVACNKELPSEQVPAGDVVTYPLLMELYPYLSIRSSAWSR